MSAAKESAKIILDNFRTYIEMYREWGLEGVTISLPDKNVGAGPRARPDHGQPRGVAPTATREEYREMSGSNAADLAVLRDEIGDCTRCKLHSGRTHLVFGAGSPQAELIFIGEAPGEDEDRLGQPFVGKAGQLLTRIIEAMGLKRENVYIANIIKCRPPGNRNPEPDEIVTCSPFIRRQIEIIRPKVICALGNFSAQTLLGTVRRISQLRGRFHDLPMPVTDRDGKPIRVMPTFHPAYLLRNPDDKKRVWEDMQMIMRELRGQP